MQGGSVGLGGLELGGLRGIRVRHEAGGPDPVALEHRRDAVSEVVHVRRLPAEPHCHVAALDEDEAGAGEGDHDLAEEREVGHLQRQPRSTLSVVTKKGGLRDEAELWASGMGEGGVVDGERTKPKPTPWMKSTGGRELLPFAVVMRLCDERGGALDGSLPSASGGNRVFAVRV